ncbi:hypothetical protein CONPUDRAFT_144175 [Coniophora puteana RWD-64-598 SS2]|uniref:Uncharacterized protein n=1 Tax=Coniophora puteana (strain RWD-64-598) TaxID=741705 RepID=A0A5M3MQC5_CONPW|nr:uncharacterized protein CONPUDRAFT_144175 [Coniophora puteana RWD-64-598 SS2]EIW81379.1 hypothetical protein CONPUDRAFT_144175 [Coniophora puteana RWD-64-598 SS2]
MEGAPFFHPALLIGPIISGTIITSILFGCAIIQAYAYFTMFTEDCRGFKILVFFITSLLFAHLVCVGSLLWQMTIVEYGTPQDLIVFPHIANVVVVLGCIITFFVQAFYIYRLARLSGSWFLPSLCSTLAALSSVFGLLVAAEAFRSTSVATVERDERCGDHGKFGVSDKWKILKEQQHKNGQSSQEVSFMGRGNGSCHQPLRLSRIEFLHYNEKKLYMAWNIWLCRPYLRKLLPGPIKRTR